MPAGETPAADEVSCEPFHLNCYINYHSMQTPFNIFDCIPTLAAPKRFQLHDELVVFLSTDPEFVYDVIAWWYEKRTTYPCLSQMALDYLTLPGKFLIISLPFCSLHVLTCLILYQPLPLTLNDFSAMASCCYLMFKIGSQLKLLRLFFVLDLGVWLVWLRMRM